MKSRMDSKVATLRDTSSENVSRKGDSRQPQPGLLAVFSGGKPQWQILTLSSTSGADIQSSSGELELGRENLGQLVRDGRISRRHARVRFGNGTFTVTDLGSLNGTSVDGQSVRGHAELPLRRCLRLGESLLLPVANVRTLPLAAPSIHDGMVLGPSLRGLYQRIARIAKSCSTLYITGESGAGKENAARIFHQGGSAVSPPGPFVAVNCAAIPEGIAERLLFGAKRGAFSGAVADSDGYVQAASSGTLFLDEIAELHETVQAKLLRVLETREVLAVGAVRPQPVNLRICSASHRSLKDQVSTGKLREDLYYRIGRPSVRVPSLRERLEEIPWLIEVELQRSFPGLRVHVSFVESCMLRHWPGNVRELLVEVRSAAQEAIVNDSTRLRAEHLAVTAGQQLQRVPRVPDMEPEGETQLETARSPSVQKAGDGLVMTVHPASARPNRAVVLATLLDSNCNVSETARRLGLHRTELRRQLTHLAINVQQLKQLTKSKR